MSKSLSMLALVTVSSLFLGGCLKNPPSAEQSTQSVVSEGQELAEAINSGRPTYCVMTMGEEKIEYWLKGQLFKMLSFTTMQDEETGQVTVIQSQAISDNTYLYSWSDQNNQGFKMKIPTTEEVAQMTEAAKEYESMAPKFDDEQSYESLKREGYTIDCQPTELSDTDFVPPTSINFVDPSEMMQGITGASGQIDMQKLQEMAKQYETTGE